MYFAQVRTITGTVISNMCEYSFYIVSRLFSTNKDAIPLILQCSIESPILLSFKWSPPFFTLCEFIKNEFLIKMGAELRFRVNVNEQKYFEMCVEFRVSINY